MNKIYLVNHFFDVWMAVLGMQYSKKKLFVALIIEKMLMNL